MVTFEKITINEKFQFEIYKMSYSVSNIEREYGDSKTEIIKDEKTKQYIPDDNFFSRPISNMVTEDYETLDETIDRKLQFFDKYNFDFIGCLLDYEPSNEEEQRYKSEILAFLFDREDVTHELYYSELRNKKLNKSKFERSNLEGHFTASAWIMTDDGEKALLTLHKKLGKCLQLGGHCDGDINILKCALKEAMEEFGITTIAFINKIFDIDVHVIPEFVGIDKKGNKIVVPEHKHYDIRFLFILPSDCTPIVNEDESNGLKFINKDYDLTQPFTDSSGKEFEISYGVQRMFTKWKKFDLESDYFISLDMNEEY